MPLKKIALLTILFLIPSFVCFIMCPFAHSCTPSKSQQLIVIKQHYQKNNLQQKELNSSPLRTTSLSPFNLQAHDETIDRSLQPSLDQQLSNKLTLLKTTRLNI